MGILRKFSAAASLTVLGASGFALAAAGPAAAAPANGTLTCTAFTQGSTGIPNMSCTATDPDGVHTVRVLANNSGGAAIGNASTPCSSGATQLSTTFINFFASSYKVVVADCGNPVAKDIYRVDTSGNVTYLRST